MPTPTFIAAAAPQTHKSLIPSPLTSRCPCIPHPFPQPAPRRAIITACAANVEPAPNDPQSVSASASASASSSPRFGLVTVLLALGGALLSLPIAALMALSSLLPLGGRRPAWHAALALFWMRAVLRLAFVRVRVRGKEHVPKGAALYVANSQSPLDMFALAYTGAPLRFAVPARLLKVPVVGWMLQKAGWIGVAGLDRRSQMAVLEECARRLQAGQSVAVFPEGKPAPGGVMGRFAAVVFRAARGMQVVPVTVNGTGEMVGEGGVVPVRWGSGVQITVHPPVEGGGDREIAEKAADAVRSALPEALRGN